MGTVHKNLITSAMWLKCDDSVIKVWVYLILQSCRGVVRESIETIATHNGKSVDEIKRVLDILSSPDPSSRNSRHDGRRIIIHSGNDWRISLVNADLYANGTNGKQIDFEQFEIWWKMYGKMTGKMVGKKQTKEMYARLDEETRKSLISKTEDWWRRRNIAARHVFVPSPPDPVRFLRHRRWEDQWVGAGDAIKRSLTKSEVAVLDAERIAHGHKSEWLDYQEAVFDGSATVGSFTRWVNETTR